jgi:ABC-2 type transport system ATP-binding protein
MAPLIEVKSLRKRFGSVLAVDGVTFDVARGEVLGFLGPNGAGKSTTMKMVTGYLPATSGTAVVCGEDIRTNPVAVKSRIGYLPEGAPLYGDMTPEGFLGFVASVRGLAGAQRKKRVDAIIERLGLDEVLFRRVETLSKGFKRRVGLAQALLHDPDVLILDEPTDGLDPNQKRMVRELIRSMGHNKAIIISTHLLEEVDAVCDRVVIIDRGKIVSDGTPIQLHARAREHNAVRIQVKLVDAPRATQLLSEIPDVLAVDPGAKANGSATLLVVPREGKFIADTVGLTIRKNNIEVSEMHTELGRLDDVFRQVTRYSNQ